jgi:hypothetical protein
MSQKKIADIIIVGLESVDYINCPLGAFNYDGLGDFEIYNPNIENKRDIEEELDFEIFVDEDEEIDEYIINCYIDEISNYGMNVNSFEIKEGVLFKFDASFNKDNSINDENRFIVDINKINTSGLALGNTFKEISFESESLALLAVERINKLNTNSEGLMNDVINAVRDLTDSHSLIESLEDIQSDRKFEYSKDINLDNKVEAIYVSSDLSKPFIECELNEFGVSSYGDSTFKDFLDNEYKFLTKAEYAVVYDTFIKETYSNAWVEIDNSFYMEQLEVLPPRNHSTINNVEFFQSSERELGNITGTFAKVGDKTFKSYQTTTVDFYNLEKEVMDLYTNKISSSIKEQISVPWSSELRDLSTDLSKEHKITINDNGNMNATIIGEKTKIKDFLLSSDYGMKEDELIETYPEILEEKELEKIIKGVLIEKIEAGGLNSSDSHGFLYLDYVKNVNQMVKEGLILSEAIEKGFDKTMSDLNNEVFNDVPLALHNEILDEIDKTKKISSHKLD